MSKLLMGALVVLSVGVFSSCKDYDDEINEHKAQISALQSDLDKLKTAQENCAKECQDRKKEAAAAQLTADKAVKDAEAAQKAAEAAQKAADAAQGTADQAVKDAAAAQAAAEAAQKAAEAAQASADAAAALAKSEAAQVKKEVLDKLAADLADLEARIAQNYVTKTDFEAELAKYTTTEDLNKLLAGVDEKIAQLRKDMEAGDKALSDKYDAVKKIVDEIYADYVKKGDLAAAVKTLDARIDGVVENVNTNKENIAVNAAAISVLQQQVLQIDINKAAIEKLTGRVATIEADYVKSADLTKLQETITAAYTAAISTATDALEKKLTDGILKTMQEAISANAQGVKTNKEAIEALTKAMNEANAAMTQRIDSLAKVTKALEENKLDKKDFDAVKNFYEKYGDKIIEVINWYTTVKDNVAKISTMLQDIENLKAQKLDKSVFDAKVAELVAKDKELLDKITKNSQDITKLREDLNAAVGRIEAVEKAIKSIKSDINKLFLFLDRDLTSIVTLPDTWLYGRPKVEAILVHQPKSFGYQNPKDADLKPAVGPNEATAEASRLPIFREDQFDAIEAKIMKEGAAKNVAFDINAKYWLNPNTVNVDNYTFSFDEIPTTAEITRGDEDTDKAEPYIKETKYSGDTLYVRFNVEKAGNVNNALTHGRIAGENHPTYAWVTTLALKATRKATNLDTETEGITKEAEANRRIISDYAILAPSYIDTLIVANGSSYVTADVLHTMGNKQGHTWNKFAGCYNENIEKGNYSFTLARLDAEAVVNLNDSLRIHYTENGIAEEKIWTIAQAKDKGFDVKYTILTDAAYFDNNNGKISVNADKRDIASTAGKTAIVLVELTAGGVTQAYGYVSIIITNDYTLVEVPMARMILNCETADSVDWAVLIDAIEEKLGTKGVIEDEKFFHWAVTDATDDVRGGFTKYSSVTPTEVAVEKNLYGVLEKVPQAKDPEKFNLKWTFYQQKTDAEGNTYNDLSDVLAKFYDKNGNTLDPDAEYAVWMKIEATEYAKTQGYDNVYVKIVIKGVKYPEAGFDMNDRVISWWYKANLTETTTEAEYLLRRELHANVETYGQPENKVPAAQTTTADDEFVFNVLNSVYDKEHDIKNQFVVEPLNGYSFGKDTEGKEILFAADMFFDASKYYIYNAADKNKDIEKVLAGSDKLNTTFAYGASGRKYLLFLMNETSLTLMAIQGDKDGKITVPANIITTPGETQTAQDVVQLSKDYNSNVTFMGWKYSTEGNPDKYGYAYDLLNIIDHAKVGEGETFTTHMIFDYDYCLPIQYENAKFDIKYLRPISAKMGKEKSVIDAVDNGARIKLGELVSFVDWRDYEFSTSKNFDYINYYGITAIEPNLDEALTNINSTSNDITKWDLLSHYDGVSFEYIAGTGSLPYADKDAFITAMGEILYQNNGLNVREFKVALPLTIRYDWGETAREWFTVTIKKTEGQIITARQK